MNHRSPVLALAALTMMVTPVHSSLAGEPHDPGCAVRITRFAFHPSHVQAGGQTSIRLTVFNCSRRQRAVTLTRYGTEPPACPVIDPLDVPLLLAPMQKISLDQPNVSAPICTGQEDITARITGSDGTLLSERHARLIIT
ncbi:MAG: hypothetical protein M3P11_00680 [Actinomycetota bacterium]|nr:hypothetical protein [Actinomycetota bacterium]